ncbi:glucosaminidase domain-containing protein [Anaerovorax odorimutans]|uniref:Glucosaminidase domain-containing protein n=1 Tax=Anaerovorax odorimutans TaxID=109327 RepID=A0ABT1RMV0_9FIRM|nr:glucosaminidase domain-containing protein [Anaerovorax odorimutans]MCQ4636514.1 glucosaminidase domain-containing protein [Anaerovorax odorimutans]
MNRAVKTAIIALLITALTAGLAPMRVAAATKLRAPEGFSASGYTYNSIQLKWKPVSGATGYKLYRADKKKGRYKAIKTLPASAAGFTDKKRKPKRAYYYKLRAYLKSQGNVYYSAYTKVKRAKGAVTKPQNFSVRTGSASDQAGLSWNKSAGVTSYKVYRAASKNGKYKLIKTLSKNKNVYWDKSRKKGAVYYYRVRAVKKAGKKTYSSPYTAKKSVCVKSRIMGNSGVTASRLAAYFQEHAVYPSYYASNQKDQSADTLEAFCQIYIDECQAEGVRADIAFCQAMQETGWLSFNGDVRISQFNFAGIGATKKGRSGGSFPDIRTGIRAHVQHLKAYACKSPLKNACVDPRFRYVKRGSAVYAEWLGIKENPKKGGWAASRNYGYKIMTLARQI